MRLIPNPRYMTGKYKKLFILIVTMLMAFSVIQSEHSSALAYADSHNEIPLSTRACQVDYARLYHDVSTGEIIGVRNVRTILDCVERSRSRIIYRTSCLPYGETTLSEWSGGHSTTRQRSQTSESISLDRIIRYIHDQDGEKDSAFLY